MRADAVSPALALAVFARDGGCIAPRLDGSYDLCAGRVGIEHVKGAPRMGKRAEACLCRLVALCDGHREPGMKAGAVWATANREACRDYLRSFGYSEHMPGHLALRAALAALDPYPAAGVTEPDVPERPNQPTTTHRVASVPVQPPRRT